ncbi:MAG: class I adenylate-forming enzyme family protein [Eubacteriales bacterium]|nr:class I adenylate-forming enzyme family protein [Eubacteriales bacterium]
MQNIVQAVLENSALMPDKTAIIVDDKKISYQELAEKILTFSGSLKMRAVKKGSRIAIESDDLISYFSAFLGCLLSGMTAVPVEKDISIYKLHDILKSTKPALIFMKNNGENYEDFFTGSPVPGKITCPKSGSIAAIIATTGTTGKPVQVAHTNKSLLAEAQNLSGGTNITSQTVLFTNEPFDLAVGYRRVFATLYAGGTAVITHKPVTAELLGNYIKKFDINAISIIHTNINMFLDIEDPDLKQTLGCLTAVETTVGPVASIQIRSFCRQYPSTALYNVYGTTESGCILVNCCSENPVERCLGKPTVHSEVFIVDENGDRVETPNQYGYIAVRGDMNMAGYYRKKALTEKVMHSDYIVINDIGYFDNEGYFFFVSRVGDIINVDGHKISPGDIEQAVSGYDGIIDCACTAMEDHDNIQAPILYVVCPDPDFDFDKLQNHLKQNLEYYKVPKKIIPIDKIPRTATGKIMRKSLSMPKKS